MKSDQDTTTLRLVRPTVAHRDETPEQYASGYDLLVYSDTAGAEAPLNIASPLCWSAVKKLAFAHAEDYPGWVVRERRTGIELTLDEVTLALTDPAAASEPQTLTVELSR